MKKIALTLAIMASINECSYAGGYGQPAVPSVTNSGGHGGQVSGSGNSSNVNNNNLHAGGGAGGNGYGGVGNGGAGGAGGVGYGGTSSANNALANHVTSTASNSASTSSASAANNNGVSTSLNSVNSWNPASASAYAPIMIPNVNTANCDGAITLGGQAIVGGGTLGIPLDNPDCRVLVEAQFLYNMFGFETACERIMVEGGEMAEAMSNAGVVCGKRPLPPPMLTSHRDGGLPPTTKDKLFYDKMKK